MDALTNRANQEPDIMQTFSPAEPSPALTHPVAASALKRLAEAHTAVSTELTQLPSPHAALLDALKTGEQTAIEHETGVLLDTLNTYWRTASSQGQGRRRLFVALFEQALRDEATLKAHENDILPDTVACLPGADDTPAHSQPTVSTLYVGINEHTQVEIHGALVMTLATGRTLLALPGSGLSEFATLPSMLETVVGWLNDNELRWGLLINAEQRHQEAVFAVADDPDVHLEPFSTTDVHLRSVSGDPYRHVIQRLIEKQRADLLYVCGDGLNANPIVHASQIEGALRLSGLFGPGAMLERRELLLAERKARTALPDWIKLASKEDLEEYRRRLRRYEDAHKALASALNGATSAEQYAQVSLRARIANDLGYDLAPDSVSISTQRTLPVTGERYLTTRTLTQLALYGLHLGDKNAGSDFLTHTTLSLDDAPIGAEHAALTPAYIADLVDELNLRLSFGQYQRTIYAKDTSQKLMRELLDRQVDESAYVAKMQGHISSDDFNVVTAASQGTPTEAGKVLRVQQIKIDGKATLSRALVFRKENAAGDLERLIMFTSDAPRTRLFQSFDNETQMLHELVAWTASPEMIDYLIEQLEVPDRPALNQTLEALRDKPFPKPGFLQLISLDSYQTGLQTLVKQMMTVTFSQLETHTPNWYVRATAEQREKLVALEDAINGALDHYAAQPHTRVQEFEDYVHQRASEKICQLLKVPAGSVNPDHIFIISERETLTYTAMMRNGYDDSFGPLTPTADTTATFKGPEGVDLSPLTAALVAGSVRGKWLADAYADLVKRTLLDPESAGYHYRRQSSALITRLQMQAAALRSLLKGHIDETQYQWLEQSIEHLNDDTPDTRAQHPVYPLQIHIDKPFIALHLGGINQLVVTDTNLTHVETVQGCYALMPTHLRLAALLYTPNAPDDIEFRAFSAFVDSLRHPGMIDYYKDRCRINARRVLSFFLNDMKQGNGNKRPTLPNEPIADFAQVCFNRKIERKLRDADETTTNRHDMLSEVIWNTVDIIATVVTAPFPPLSFAVGVALALRDVVKAVQALAGHNPEAAPWLFLAAGLNLLGAYGDLEQGLKGFGGIARKLAENSKPGARPAALKKPSKVPKPEGLYPVKLDDQAWLISRPDTNGNAQVYQNLAFEPDDVYPTGQYLARTDSGAWQPLDRPSSAAPSASNCLSRYRIADMSVQDLTRIGEGHAKGVSLGNGKFYIDMNGAVYQVNYDAGLRCWHIVDPQNPFAFFGRQPVRLNEQGQWQVIERSRLRGGSDTPGSANPAHQGGAEGGATSTGLQAYELPADLQPLMYEILIDTSMDAYLVGLGEFFDVYFKQMRETYLSLRNNLYREAQAFFANPIAKPARPALPAIDASTTVAGFLQSAFAQSNGLVVSEAAKSVASKRLLMMNMQALVEQRVEVIYIQHLFTDKHTRKLAKYHAKGRTVRTGSHEIKNHLKYINQRALDNLSREYDYYHLIKEAHRHGIEVRPLSSSVSYPLNDHPVAAAAGDGASAQKMSNFFSHKVIDRDVVDQPNKRWIALVDQRLATTHDQVPGLADLQGALSVHIEDVPAGQPTRIQYGANLVDTDVAATPADFKIEFAQSGSVQPPSVPAASTATTAAAIPRESVVALSATDSLKQRVAFRWNDTTGWQRVAPQEWIADAPPTSLQQSLIDPLYDMPLASRDALFELTYAQHHGLDSNYFIFDERLNRVEEQFFALRDTLRENARSIRTVDQPPRPTLPSLAPQPNMEQFIQSLYEQTDGMVIGEFHASIASKKLIMDNLPLLKQQNVKTLYMEHLFSDLHQADLDRFLETGVMSDRLLLALRRLDSGHLTDPSRVYNFEKLIIKAQQHGIEVRAIDCAASYHLSGLRLQSQTTRQQMMNFYASRMIRRHQAVMGRHNWVALVGNSHSNTYLGVPGLAELEGGIGIRVTDVRPGASKGITPDPGELARAQMSNEQGFVKGNFLVEIEVPGSPMAIRPPQPLPMAKRLARPGMFVAEQDADSLYVIVHKSRTHEIHRTPVQVNDEGKVFVDRPTWASVHLQPYDDIDALILGLEGINLTRVG
jgi:hypothetical protein